MAGWFEIFLKYLPYFIQGTIITLKLTFVGLIFGAFIGLPTALGRVYGGRWLRTICVAYIELFRGTPLLVQLFVVYFGLPQLGLTFSRMTAAYLVLALNSGAYQAEYFRGAIQAIGSGQMMAARSIGMSRIKAIRHIILPQTARLVIPAWSNEPISLLKASAVVFLIAVPDLMTQAKTIAARTFQPIGTYIIVAIFYLIVVFILTGFLQVMENRFKIPGLELEAQRT
jgi:polar amino acid transport system permease protein